MANAAVPIRRTVRDRLSTMRKNTSGLSIPYRTAKKMEGAKSTGRGVPPIGVGNLELIVGGTDRSWGVELYRSEHLYIYATLASAWLTVPW